MYAFIDTNIFLDFYRAGNEATLTMLDRLRPVASQVISTYQVEMEYYKNRQVVIGAALKEIKNPNSPVLPAVFSDSATSTSLKSLSKESHKKVVLLKARLKKLLDKPKANDVVYQVLQTIFQSDSAHVLTRDMNIRTKIKRLALRRFLMGYPPRKNNDTSYGDAINWEWLIHCGNSFPGKLVIVSRDTDYGITIDDTCYLNDQLREEFRERVGKKSIVFTNRLSVALKELHVEVPAGEIQAESETLVRIAPPSPSTRIEPMSDSLLEFAKWAFNLDDSQ